MKRTETDKNFLTKLMNVAYVGGAITESGEWTGKGTINGANVYGSFKWNTQTGEISQTHTSFVFPDYDAEVKVEDSLTGDVQIDYRNTTSMQFKMWLNLTTAMLM